MTQIIVDPIELRKFATALQELRSEFAADRRYLNTHLDAINAFWNDAKYRKLRSSSTEVMLAIDDFVATCDRYCDYLERKAAAAEAYLGR